MNKEKENIDIMMARHSLSHVMAMAVLKLFPEAKLAIGPAIENGFYYDFDLSRSLSPEDLPKIEKIMREIISRNFPIVRSEKNRDDALIHFADFGQKYKVELIDDLPDEKVGFFTIDFFADLCKGPHVESTGNLKNIGWKLDKIAGAYWRADEKNAMLQRIYGLAFENEEELEKYEKLIIEAEKRDHRKLGKELDLFSFHEEGPGFPFWHPKGIELWNAIITWWRSEHRTAGYVEVKTPIILDRVLWKNSGHWDHYKENMYFTKIDDRDFAIKPMNCPGGILIYKTNLHSYRDLPIRMGEIGLVHRHELAGVLHGLLRVRQFHQDDAHIFCTEDQVQNEVVDLMALIDRMYKKLGLKYHLELSTRPDNSMGSDEMWQKAEAALISAMKSKNIEYKLNPGDGAFYGPKIDFHIEDAIGRTWQLGTIQLDFQMPERFDLEYIAEDGLKKRPVMLHRVILGSVERFIGIIIEHFAGAFPVWMAPVQAIILPISDKHLEYAEKIKKELFDAGVRVELDSRTESVGRKIRDAEMQKIPYMLIVGDKEIEANKVAVRRYGDGDKGQVEITELLKQFK
ncbi:threonine--tRNA ligase [Candidatus Berkelbacteria bacterium CG10_big_fil_rev_8_21_14_0_10_43_13]|uniref:Threonine--tRNA ligase n=1 Tax=Candidatus Berkelbacteria bacterium CG10_big_fil_rev_8_21_14_0_10_43_13 TaxID=1974514 RepID=A0A2H0W6K9_9BACT|nr:MAG: threonine--tRNA ligase [Candidatus Berkelbacteria bacterium CG10_big_fil_rev_8_21_14_0_10_43_13]